MEGLDILMEDARWQGAGLETLALRAVEVTLAARGLDPADCALALLACDDARIAALNADHRGKPAPTNVLSWPSEERAPDDPAADPAPPQPDLDGTIELGDIALSFDTCAAEAAAADRPLSAHATHLIVHGVLHLLGYDHIDPAAGDLMETREIEILGKLGLPDPYST